MTRVACSISRSPGVLFLAVACLFAPASARAGARIGFTGGLTLPTSAKVADTNYGATVNGALYGPFCEAGEGAVRPVFDLGFHQYDNFTATSLRARLKVHLVRGRSAGPYLVGGAGGWRLSTNSGIRGALAADVGLGLQTAVPGGLAAAVEATFEPMSNGEPSVFLVGLRLMTSTSHASAHERTGH